MVQIADQKRANSGQQAPVEIITGERLPAFLDAMRHSIAYRAYEHFEARNRQHGNDLRDWFRSEDELTSHLSPVITESKDSVLLKIQLSGLQEDELTLAVEPRRVILRSRKPLGTSPSRETFRFADLPGEIEPKSAESTVHAGTLEVRINKVHP